MYNLIMTSRAGAWEEPNYVLPFGRFLEYTDDEAKATFQTFDVAATEALMQLPTLFAYEQGSHATAKVGWISKLQRREGEIRITPKLVGAIPDISSSIIESLSWDLGIGSAELYRTHWAVKGIDLVAVLREHKILGGSRGEKALAKTRPTPSAGYTSRNLIQPPLERELAQDRAKVFVVHGRDNGAKQEVARYLSILGLEPIILHERPNVGRTLISKFREESANIAFAVVLMTPDDLGTVQGESNFRPRARQNVVFELGFFLGKIGPERVCALVGGHIERPSDFEAVVYIEYGQSTPWRMELARELRAAGIVFDYTKAI